jgi:short-subunit dehydrogenase
MKTVLITGASSGIGYETALVYAARGYQPILLARREEKLKNLQEKIEQSYNIEAVIITMDLSQPDSADKLMGVIDKQNLKIDVFINNAGFGLFGAFIEHDTQELEQMLILNMVTLTKLTQFIGSKMVVQGGGKIVNIASTAAYQPVPKLAAYSATKSYVMNFSEAIAYELKDNNVQVTVICPGATQSEFAQVAGFKEGENSFPTSKELAHFIYDKVTKGKTNAIHGIKNNLLAFSNRFVPRKITTRIAAKMMD